jgi:putative redox protein
VSPLTPDDRTVVVRPGPNGGFQHQATVGDHVIMIDEPASVGGADSGPTPYDLILAALGACTSMTMRLYADRKGIPLDDAEVTLSHRRIHARDCADCETAEGMLDEISVVIRLVGALADEQRERLLRIAEICPVHRSLAGEIKIRTRLADA